MKMREENIKDIAALGGNPVYFLAAALFWLFGYAYVAYQLAVSLAMCYAATTFFRVFLFRERPKKQKYRSFLERIDASSFPSLHAMRAAAMAVTAGMFFNDAVVWALAALAAVSVAAARVLQKRHHVRDVAGGLVIGTAIALISVFLITG